MSVLAIDQGTSSSKALVVDGEHRILAEHSVQVTPHAFGDGAVEQDPREVLESVLTAGRRAIELAGELPSCVGIANQGETVLHWDPRSGEPLGPAISWQDSRATVVARELELHAPRLEAITGLPLDPYFAAPKITWLRRRVGSGGVITTIDAWINRQLTGRTVTDAATASRTMLLDLDAVSWSAEACGYFDIEGALPEIAGCGEHVGDTSAFGPSLPVTGLIVDQQAALLAESCLSEAEAKCTYGTGAFLLANAGPQAPRSRSRLAACVAWLAGDQLAYCLDGQVFTAGAAVSWLQRVGLLSSAAEIDALLAGRSATDARTMFVPALAGLGAPDWRPRARAGWTGLTLASDRADLVGAVVWGIAAAVATLARAIEADLGRPLAALRVDGGLSRSVELMQAQADLLALPVQRYPHADATALGVAALARIGHGEAATLADAVGPWRPVAVYEPRANGAEVDDYLERFRSAVSALIDLDTGAGEA